MRTTFHAKIRKQSNSLIVTIPNEVVGMLSLEPKQTLKIAIEDKNNENKQIMYT